MNKRRMWAVARNDLRQLAHSPDFWAPMLVLAALFFVILPTILLLTITNLGAIGTVQKVSAASTCSPRPRSTPSGAQPPPTGPPTRWPSISSRRWR
ncbi:MAG: hypothetical protein M3Y04_04920 [Actinomycetota bacterium]|nr:hypothetical protein [Actinomycetota bacterium]